MLLKQPLRFASFLSNALLLCLRCNHPNEPAVTVDHLFTSMPPSYTSIDFVNQLEYDEEFNVYTYRNFYNGGGVGLADVNNDGLTDVFFCGNLVDNKLYLNRGDFRFEDITRSAGVGSAGVWSTGVSLADVNGDGWIDIYVCKSGDPQGENRHNELFINNADPSPTGVVTFTERARDYGIADQGLSTHAAFFDYDRDGDLDMYLLNNSFRSVGGYDLRPGQREIRDPQGGNKLYRNDEGHFTDVSEAAGIYGSAIGFGLGVTIGDVNRDGWQDIYVSNDFFERDYLYINQQDGTFTEDLEAQMPEISLGSMGADMADINHDGYPDVFVTEMLPESERRYKTKAAFETWDKYQMNVKNGYHQQFARNVLQLNTPVASADSSQKTVFREVGRLAGVHATDWSWGALMADLDNNGEPDIFVANGIYKDLLDQDYIQFMGDPQTVRAILTRENAVIKQLIDSIPSERIANYAFSNQGDFTFVNKAKDWGLDKLSHSNGSAYGDLDNDGDLDLVVNNVNMPPFIYRNETDTLLNNHFIRIQLMGAGKNTFALGAQVTLWHSGKMYYQELAPMRGFQSTVDTKLVFGLGKASQVDSLRVQWPDGRTTTVREVAADQLLTLRQNEATERSALPQPMISFSSPLFQDVTASLKLDFEHRENVFSDFDRDPLLFHMLSAEGPKLATGDVNGDGRADFFVGGAKDQPGALFVQQPNGTFARTNQEVLEKDQSSEDTDALFFDADQDGDLDLYVASGGSELPSSSSALLDRLYLNDGRGNFSKSQQLLPTSRFESTACVRAADYDQDGDLDLFVGTRLRPFLYGVPVNGYLLQNDGRGNFSNVTEQVAPELMAVGMITAAQWVDYDQDQDQDLIIVGDWMAVRVFENNGGNFVDKTQEAGLAQTQGFWNCLEVTDLDGDGDLDLVAGNLGRNTRLKASPEQPLTMHVNDFDGNGKAEQIVSMYQHDTLYPLTLRNDLVKQVPSLKKKYLRYDAYQGQTIEDLFSPEQLRNTVRWEVHTTESVALINQGNGQFAVRPLPTEAQFSPVYSILADDFDQDGHVDLLLGGNFYRSKPEIGIYDASYGLTLQGDGKGQFDVVEQSGFFVRGEVRDIVSMHFQGKKLWLVAKNNAPLEAFTNHPSSNLP